MDLSIDILSDYLDEIENVISLIEDKNNGYEITRNDSEDKYGLKIYKHFDNIDNVSFGERSEEGDEGGDGGSVPGAFREASC